MLDTAFEILRRTGLNLSDDYLTQPLCQVFSFLSGEEVAEEVDESPER